MLACTARGPVVNLRGGVALFYGFLFSLVAACGGGPGEAPSPSQLKLAHEMRLDNFGDIYNKPRHIIAAKRRANGVDLFTVTMPIRVEVLREDLVKVRFANAAEFKPEYTYSISDSFKPEATPFTLTEDSAALTIQTSQLKLTIQRDNGGLRLDSADGTEVLALNDLFSHPFDDTLNQKPGLPPQHRLTLGARFTMHDDDHFYGLGEKIRGRFDTTLDWRGIRRDYEDEGQSMGNRFEGNDGGANGNMMVPFLWTTRGAGVFLDTVYHTYWDFDDQSGKSWQVRQDCDQDWEAGVAKCERSEMRFYLSVGDSPQKILQRYVDLTGHAVMPPRWMFGFMQSAYGYQSWDEVESVASSLATSGMPLDAIFLDLQWFGGVPGAHGDKAESVRRYAACSHRQVGTLTWQDNDGFDFAGPKPHLRRLLGLGVHIVPIEEGYIDTCLDEANPVSQNFAEAEAGGFLARRDFGSNKAAIFANGDDILDSEPGAVGYFGVVGMVDMVSAEARRWFWSKHLPILQDGAAAFWVDLGEPERFRWWWKYAGDLWHQDIHNVWELHRARMFAEGYARDLPQRRPFVMSRSGYAGIQRYGVGIWSADTPSRLAWAAPQASAHLNLAISGVPYSTSDIGGFNGTPVSNGKQYSRWLQSEIFSPLLRAHGHINVDENAARIVEPDGFGEPYTSINRAYLNWRERLVPYLYTLAREAYDTGMPMMRALPLVWPHESALTNIGSEFMVGEILVAPVLEGVNNNPSERRDLFLPPGLWIDMHDGATYQGNRWLLSFPAPLAKLPLFARQGAILAKAPGTSSLAAPEWQKARVFEIYPPAAGDASGFTLYDDDGETPAYQQAKSGSARTAIDVTSRVDSSGASLIKIEAAGTVGSYTGMPAQRAYALEVHAETLPQAFSWQGQTYRVDATPLHAEALVDWTKAIGELDPVWSAETKKFYVKLPAQDLRNAQHYLLRL